MVVDGRAVPPEGRVARAAVAAELVTPAPDPPRRAARPSARARDEGGKASSAAPEPADASAFASTGDVAVTGSTTRAAVEEPPGPRRDATRRDRQGERTKGGDRDGDDKKAADDPEPVPPPGPTTEVPTPTPVPPGYERGDETADNAADPDAPERTAWESEPAADEEATSDGR